MKPALVLAALISLGAGLLTAVPTATADPAPEVTVVWPEVTRFNPTTYSYDAVVTNNGNNYLVADWSSSEPGQHPSTGSAPVPESGHVSPPPQAEGPGTLQIWSCPVQQSSTVNCNLRVISPYLELRTRAVVLSTGDPEDGLVGAGTSTTQLSYRPTLMAGDVARASWELLRADKSSFPEPVRGTVSANRLHTDVSTQRTRVPFVIPAGTPSGRYYLDVQIHLETADFGSITGGLSDAASQLVRLTVDTDAPSLKVGKVPPTVFPAPDHYLDRVGFRVTSDDDEASATLDVLDATGDRVYRSRSAVSAGPEVDYENVAWGGHTNRGEIVPEGTYTLQVTVADYVGNTDTWRGKIDVSHKKLEWKEFKRRVAAAASRIGKPFVGSCSTLSSPARGGPRGSLGFYSESKCHGDSRAGTVVTNHGMHIPQAYHGEYRYAWVTLNGGPAGGRDDYIVLGYLKPGRGRFLQSRVLKDGQGAHDGHLIRSNMIWDRKGTRPYILWSNGLTAGSRYVVRSYTVHVMYLDFG